MDQDSNHPTEVELKLLFPPRARADLERHPAFGPPRATAPAEHHLVTTYYDTPDLALAGKGITLRVRRDGDDRVQAVKSGGSHAVAPRRGEWEWPIQTDGPDLGLLASTMLGTCVNPALATMLQPVFVSDIHRTIRILRLDGGTMIEAAMDEGSIIAGETAEAVHELELEIKEGSVGPLYRLALELHAAVPLRIGVEPKAARGYRLRTGRPPEVEVIASPGLDRHLTGAESVQRMISATLGGLLANQPAAEAGEAEGVHQTRIAIRRLRTALVLFKPHLARRTVMRLEAELRRVGQVLGAARDWDVFCLQILPEALRATTEQTSRKRLQEAAEVEREFAYKRLREEFGKPDLTRLILDMAAWAEAHSDTMGDRSLQERLPDLAPELLDRIMRRARKRGRHIGRRSDQERHALRKSLKKLRYGAHDMATLYPRKAVKPYLKRCKTLLDTLGQLNDAAMAAALAKRLSESHPDIAAAADAVAGWSGKRRRRALRHLSDDWRAFRNAEPFWR